MDSLAQIGLIATCVIAIYVGIRTLWIWRTTRMVQELCIGANILAIAFGGLVLTLLGEIGGDRGQKPPLVPLAFGLLGLVVHVAALYIGTWKIFRPRDRWPLLMVAAATAIACAWMSAGVVLAGSTDWLEFRSLLLLTLRGVGMTWAAYECLRYSAMLRRRAAVGLGDPMIAHQIWLWGFGAITSLITIFLDFTAWALFGQPLAATPLGLHAMSVFGLIGTCAIGGAFFPPAFYVRLMERRFATQFPDA